MTTTDREEQLRYETDAEGNVLVDEENNPRPRPQYVISKFACDPNRHIQLDQGSGMIYKLDEIIKFILDKEVELGFLTKAKRPKKQKAAPAVATQQPTEETNMPVQGRKIIRPNAKAQQEAPAAEESAPPAAPAPGPKVGPVGLPRVPGNAKIAQPPKGRFSPAAAAAPQGAPAPAAGGAGVDLDTLSEMIQVAVTQIVSKIVDEKLNEAVAHLTAKTNEVIEAVAAAGDRSVDAITILHDMSIVTRGTFCDENGEYLEQKFEKDDRILDYLNQG